MPQEAKPERFELRCTEQQLSKWSKSADSDDRTLSAWIRHTLDKAAAKAPRKR